MDTELERFKTNIDLRQFAASMGYALDPRESWRSSAAMRSGADKIIITRQPDGHYVYFSVRDDGDNGTIIDFLQKRRLMTLGNVRKALRPWICEVAERPPLPLAALRTLEKISANRAAVEAEYEKTDDNPACAYLEVTRALPDRIGTVPRFLGRVRIDARTNIIFPHYDELGLCGFEKKNRGFTGFAAGGAKGLWLSHQAERDRRLVFCESGIECLSHATLFPDDSTRYASIGGRTSTEQPKLVAWQVALLPHGEVVASMNADLDGRKLAAVVKEAFANAGRSDLAFRFEEPQTEGADWNDLLKSGHGGSPTSLPAALERDL
jgi:hypothetical protein